MQINYRLIKETEYEFLEEMLYEALFVPNGKQKFPKSIIENPEIRKYIENWGSKKEDIAIVAVKKGRLIGAIWGRRFTIKNKGYGFIDEDTPEISMAVKEEFRNNGIGTKLLGRIKLEYLKIGIHSLSLSVHKANLAKFLYERNGYELHEEKGTALIMKREGNRIQIL